MSVALFFVTHEGIASTLLTVAADILQKSPDNVAFIEIKMDASVSSAIHEGCLSIDNLDTENGLIIITDIYGSTPSNIAQALADKFHSHFISGVNLPMLIRLLNYRKNDLDSLTQKALKGGIDGIQKH